MLTIFSLHPKKQDVKIHPMKPGWGRAEATKPDHCAISIFKTCFSDKVSTNKNNNNTRLVFYLLAIISKIIVKPKSSPKSKSQIQVPNSSPNPKSKVQRKGNGTGADNRILP